MSEEKPDRKDSREATPRRRALKRIARYGAVSAPAIALLLAASAKPKKAWAAY
jgi:hypothetical protein